jgi:20S proteasome subunit alpha 4
LTTAARCPDCTRQSLLVSTQLGKALLLRHLLLQCVIRWLTFDCYRKANAIGRSSKTVREFLERNYKEDMDRQATIRLAIKSLLEVVQTGAKNIEIALMAPGASMELLPTDEIESFVKEIEQEKQEEAAKKKTGRTPGTGSAAILTRSGDDSAAE